MLELLWPLEHNYYTLQKISTHKRTHSCEKQETSFEIGSSL